MINQTDSKSLFYPVLYTSRVCPGLYKGQTGITTVATPQKTAMNRYFTYIHMHQLCLILVQPVQVLAILCGTLAMSREVVSCWLYWVLPAGFRWIDKIGQESYGDSPDLPGICWHWSLLIYIL